MINIKSLRVDYDGVVAVKDLDLEIPKGQIYGLVGPNGAGKTSTIKAIAGIITPTYGDISIDGNDLSLNRVETLCQLGYMPDFPPVYENLKVWEYLDVFAAAYLIKKNQRKQKIDHWLQKVNLSEKRDSYVKELSRGMRQRLILAKTLLPDPKVVILDEPASGLDPIARREMQMVLLDVADKDRTILISSHILAELADFCNAVGIMEKGKMVVSGAIEEIRSHLGAKGKLIVKLAEKDKSILDEIFQFFSSSKFVESTQMLSENEIQANFLGEVADAQWLLTQLIKKEYPVYDFRIEEVTVEDIFFQIGAQEVS